MVDASKSMASLRFHANALGLDWMNQALDAVEAERDRLRSALNLERQRLVSWADRLAKKHRDDDADQVHERIAAIDRAMQPDETAGEHADKT
jgi:hypothetical protein